MLNSLSPSFILHITFRIPAFIAFARRHFQQFLNRLSRWGKFGCTTVEILEIMTHVLAGKFSIYIFYWKFEWQQMGMDEIDKRRKKLFIRTDSSRHCSAIFENCADEISISLIQRCHLHCEARKEIPKKRGKLIKILCKKSAVNRDVLSNFNKAPFHNGSRLLQFDFSPKWSQPHQQDNLTLKAL